MSANTSNRKTVRFADRVGPDSSKTLTKKVAEAATVDRVDVRIYTGPRLDLRVLPFVEPQVGGNHSDRVPLVDLVGKDYIDGDGDRYSFYPTESVEREDRVGVEVVNVDQTHGYDVAVDVTLDREGGASRSLSSFVSGWF